MSRPVKNSTSSNQTISKAQSKLRSLTKSRRKMVSFSRTSTKARCNHQCIYKMTLNRQSNMTIRGETWRNSRRYSSRVRSSRILEDNSIHKKAVAAYNPTGKECFHWISKDWITMFTNITLWLKKECHDHKVKRVTSLMWTKTWSMNQSIGPR